MRMKDELFTMMPEMPAMSPEMMARLEEEHAPQLSSA